MVVDQDSCFQNANSGKYFANRPGTPTISRKSNYRLILPKRQTVCFGVFVGVQS